MKILFIANDTTPDSKSDYIKTDFSLDVYINYKKDTKDYANLINNVLLIPSKTFVVSIDTLTLSFEGEALILKSLDAYTNQAHWKKAVIALPSDAKQAICKVTSDINEDRYKIDKKNSYYFDETNKILKIKIDNMKPDEYYQVATNLLFGVSKEFICEILITNFKLN